MSDGDRMPDEDRLAGDTLSASLIFLAAAQILQRSIGLGRNIVFCGMLTDEQLGRWSLTFNFLILAAPLVVLGLPGSFGRYVEHYRQRGHLRSFLLRIAIVTGIATAAATALQFVAPGFFAELIFGDRAQVHIIAPLAICLCIVIAFNCLVELFTAMRLVRYAAALQLTSSLCFAAAGAGLLYFTQVREDGLVLAYAAASLLAVLVGIALLSRCWTSIPRSAAELGQRHMWFKLLPFAGWLWATNLVGNLFDVADQFMLKHFSSLPAADADALIGQYYSSRVIPVLLVALAGMVGSSLLPHLSHDWERGRRDLVQARMRLAVKLTAIFFTAAAAAVLVLGPTFFTWFLGQKFATGMAVLPGTLIYCVWYCVTCIALGYLLCAEAAHLSSLAFLGGLLVNVALNVVLAPRFGLPGVVAATAVANATALSLTVVLCSRRGMIWRKTLWISLLLPLTLGLGGAPAAAIVGIVTFVGWRRGLLFDAYETAELGAAKNMVITKLRRLLPLRQPSATSLEKVKC